VSECARVFKRLNEPLLKEFQISHVNFSPENDRPHSREIDTGSPKAAQSE